MLTSHRSSRPLTVGRFAQLLLLMILVGGAIGCNDDADFLINGGDNLNALSTSGSGSLNFQFVQPQAALVPDGVATMSFDFYSAIEPEQGELVLSTTRPYSPSITIDNVPSTARSVVITAFDQSGRPLLTIVDQVAVVPGSVTTVDLADAGAEPIALSGLSISPDEVSLSLLRDGPAGTQQLTLIASYGNGDTNVLDPATVADRVTFSSQPDGIVTVGKDGLMTAVAPGETTVTATLDADGPSPRTAQVKVTVLLSPAGGGDPR